MRLREKTAKGISWTILSQAARVLINFIVLVILARLLNPKDFGLVAMATVFSNLFVILNDLGLPSAIIQKKELSKEDLSSAFWITMFEGFVLTVAFFLLAPVVAGFYSSSALKPIIMVLSIPFVLSSLGMIQSAIFARNLDFKTLAIVEIVSVFAGGCVAVTLAATGFGVWSIVFQSVTTSFLFSIILFVISDWKPRLVLKWSAARGLLGYGLPLLGYYLINYFNRNVDNLLIGKYLGAKQLGYYDVAYKGLLFPLWNISHVFGKVMFPALSRLEEDKSRVRSSYTQATKYISLVTFPLMAGVAVLAPQLVHVALGPNGQEPYS